MGKNYRLSDDIISRLMKSKERLCSKQRVAIARGQSRIVREIDTSLSYIEMVLEGVYEYD